jgi:hypothetical protein
MKTILAAALIAASTSASAFFDGNRLLNDLQSSNDVKRAFGTGFVAGVADAADGIDYCLPVGVTVGQLRDIVLRRLVRHPNIRHEPAALIVEASMMVDFPCEPQKKGEMY